MMDPEIQALLEEQLAAVTALHREQRLEADLYYKCLVAIAHDYAVSGDAARAASLVQSIPVSYFQVAQRTQMLGDVAYAEAAYVLALALVQEGYVHMGPRISTTLPAARA